MKTDTFIYAISGLLFLSGCGVLTVGPSYNEPTFDAPAAVIPDAGYPTTNTTSTGEFAPATSNDDPRVTLTEESIRGWWCNFNDPTLTNLVETALSNNCTFLMAQQRLIQARWRYLGSAAPLWPSIGLNGSATRNEWGKNTATGSGMQRTIHRDVFRGGFDMTWEIDVFGGERRSVESAHAASESAEYSFIYAWVSLTSEIGDRYITLRTVQERLSVARTNLVIQSETFDILKSRLDSGIGDELAVNQARYNVEQTRATIPTLLAQEEQLMNALAILAGMMPGTLHDELATRPARDWLLEPKKIDELPLNLIRTRPDVKAVERALAAQVAAVGVAKSMLYPKFYINGSLGLESVKIQKFLRRDSLYGAIGPSVSWPLFQGGNITANIKIEESKMNEAMLNYEKTIQIALSEVRNAYSAYTQEYHRYQSLQGAVKAATDAVSISRDLYANGISDFNNVLDAQRSLLALEEALAISRGAITTNLIALYKAFGGGW